MKLKVLVVDDNDIVRDIVVAQLEHFGHAGKAVVSLQETLDAVHQWQPDAVMLDLLMPDHDGFEVLKLVRESFPATSAKNPHVPRFVAITGEGTAARRQAAHDAGFDLYLKKPFKLAELSNILERLSESLQLRDSS